MSIPALIGTDVALDETVDGKFAVVDGTNGVLYVEPDEETLETMRRRQQEEQEKKEHSAELLHPGMSYKYASSQERNPFP